VIEGNVFSDGWKVPSVTAFVTDPQLVIGTTMFIWQPNSSLFSISSGSATMYPVNRHEALLCAGLSPLATVADETRDQQITMTNTQLIEKIGILERQIIEANYQNSYLETRLAGLEDQTKFLTQSHYHNNSLTKFLIVLPVLALLAAIAIIHFSAIPQM
jgi:hypothetical protein